DQVQDRVLDPAAVEVDRPPVRHLGRIERQRLVVGVAEPARAVTQRTLSACPYPGLTWEHGWSVGLGTRTSPARALPLDPHTTHTKS
ncbi:MAG TPA: hypothetical protein VLL94_07385, partial [Nitrospiraceae bacterium]|nr:hypothetical protein [Nitrospiraceae bacterium]